MIDPEKSSLLQAAPRLLQIMDFSDGERVDLYARQHPEEMRA